MRIALLRCKHCGVEYRRQLSGYPTDVILSESDEYCLECYNKIEKALSEIPKNYHEVYINVEDVTIEEMFEHHKTELDTISKGCWIFNSLQTICMDGEFGQYISTTKDKYKLILRVHNPWFVKKEEFLPTYVIVKKEYISINETPEIIYTNLSEQHLSMIESLRRIKPKSKFDINKALGE